MSSRTLAVALIPYSATVLTDSVPSVQELRNGGIWAVFIPMKDLRCGHWIGVHTIEHAAIVFDPLGIPPRNSKKYIPNPYYFTERYQQLLTNLKDARFIAYDQN